MKILPCFSIRTLAVFVTLVCAYLGAWEATQKYGVPEESMRLRSASAPLPFLVQHEDVDYYNNGTFKVEQRFYIWLFGTKIQLPFQATLDHGHGGVI